MLTIRARTHESVGSDMVVKRVTHSPFAYDYAAKKFTLSFFFFGGGGGDKNHLRAEGISLGNYWPRSSSSLFCQIIPPTPLKIRSGKERAVVSYPLFG